MDFSMIKKNQNIQKKQNGVILIQTSLYADVYYCMDTEALLYTLKQKMYMEALQKMLKKKLILQIMNQKDHCI